MKVLTYKSEDNLDKVVEQLQKGKLVVYPTDTIYGIAANINDTKAIKKVYSTKERSPSKPLSVCFHDLDQLKDYVVLNHTLTKIIKKLLPGSYTLLLYKKENINPILTSNSPIVGVRIPKNIVSYKLTEHFPITSTSANISNEKTPDNIYEIQKQLGDKIDCYIDGGLTTNNKASTIIDLTKEKPYIIRKGTYDKKLLNEILKINL